MTLSEIDAIYPGSVPDHLMDRERQWIRQAMSRPEQEEEVLESESNPFSIEQCVKLQELLKSRGSSAFRKRLNAAMKEMEKII